MKYLSAYLLAVMGGNASPTAKDILKILGAAGLDVDMEDANAVVNSLSGKSVEELIGEGKKKLASVPSGGGSAAVAKPGAAAAKAPAAAPAAKKEEPKKEESEEEDMGFGLFD